MNRLTRVFDSSVVLAGAGGGGGGGGGGGTGGSSASSSIPTAPENAGARDAASRFTEQILEQFWLYHELI